MSYDRALTVFSPDGHLFQIEYAMEAVKRGSTAIGVCGKDCVVMAVEKKTVSKLQDSHTIRKVCKVDEHIYMSYAGLLADARILLDMARVQSHSFRLNHDATPDVAYIADHVAQTQQKYTQRGGKRPFGVSTMLGGFNFTDGGLPHLFITEPSGISVEWKACVIGHGQKTVREYLEKLYQPQMTVEAAIHLAVRSLLEVVESGQKNIDVLVMASPTQSYWIPDAELDQLVHNLEKEREAENERKKKEMD